MKDKELIIISGPTASGKTGLGVELALRLGTEVVSADSRQIFKEMCIGTAVPSTEERKGVIHHLIQTVSIHENYNASRFENEALNLLENLFGVYEKVVMVGGSGLYINALKYGIDDLPAADPEVRRILSERMEKEGIESLRKELKILDPISYSWIDLRNPMRVLKALEVSIMTGIPYSSHLNRSRKERNFLIRQFVTNPERKTLYENINRRVDGMIADGLIGEAEGLMPFRERNALNTVGYREIFGYLEGNLSKEEAIVQIKNNTRKYARKQITWFRKDRENIWCDSNQEVDYILKKLNE